jgi:hypothetical protein
VVKLWVTFGPLFRATTSNRYFPCDTLYCRCEPGFLQCCSYLPGCKLWVVNSDIARQWGIIFFHLHLRSCRAGFVLWVIPFGSHLNGGCSPIIPSHGYRVYRVRVTLGSDVFLGRYSYYKSFISGSLFRDDFGKLSMGRVCCRQPHLNSIFRYPFSSTIYCVSIYINSFVILTPDRVK